MLPKKVYLLNGPRWHIVRVGAVTVFYITLCFMSIYRCAKPSLLAPYRYIPDFQVQILKYENVHFNFSFRLLNLNNSMGRVKISSKKNWKFQNIFKNFKISNILCDIFQDEILLINQVKFGNGHEEKPS